MGWERVQFDDPLVEVVDLIAIEVPAQIMERCPHSAQREEPSNPVRDGGFRPSCRREEAQVAEWCCDLG